MDSTKDVINKLNKSLVKANTGFKITLTEPKDIYPGDLRINSLVLITDPLEIGLLGYGPSVANPRTGEILNARTNMYLGVFRQLSRSIYKHMEGMAIESPLTQTSSISSKSSNNEKKTLYEINKEEKEVALKLNKLTEKASLNKNDIHLYHDNKNIFEDIATKHFHNSQQITDKDYFSLVENNKAYSSIFSDILPSDSISILENENIQEKKVNYFAKHNAFSFLSFKL